MKRIILLFLGLTSGLWVLRDFNSNQSATGDNTVECSAAETHSSATANSPSDDVVREHVDVLPGSDAPASETSAVRAVKYSVQVDDDSLAANVVVPEAAPSAPKSAAADGAALGRWALNVLRAIFSVPTADPATPAAAPTAVVPTAPPTVEHVADKPTNPASTSVETTTTSSTSAESALNASGDSSVGLTNSVERPIADHPAAVQTTSDKSAAEHPAVVAAGSQDSAASAATSTVPTTAPVTTPSASATTSAAPSTAASSVASDLPHSVSASSNTQQSAASDSSGAQQSPAVSSATKSPDKTSDTAGTESTPAKLETLPASNAAVSADGPPARPPLTPELEALSQKVQYAIAMYQHQRLLNTGTNVPWEVMHRFVAFGANTEVLKDGPGGQPVNAIGWLLWGGRCGSQPVLVLSAGRPYAMVGVGVEGHPGQLLAMLAQSRIRPESPFKLDGQSFTVHDLVEQEKLACDRSVELTFELIATSYYLKTNDTWTARDGEEWSISRLVHEEIRQPIHNVAACGGSHRLFGLSCAFKKRMCEGKPVDGEFLQAQNYIHAYQRWTLGSLQNADGSLSTDWFKRPADNGDLDRKIQTTGHMLEWLVFSLDDNQLRDPRLIRCVDFLATQIIMHPNRAWSVGPFGHALHALTLYQAREFEPQGPQFLQPTSPGSWAMRHKSSEPIAHDHHDDSEKLAPLPPVKSMAKANVPAPTHAVLSSHPQQIMLPEPKADLMRTAARPETSRVAHPAASTTGASGGSQGGPDLGITR